MALKKRPAAKWLEAVDLARQKLVAGQNYRSQMRERTWQQSERQYEGDHWSGAYVDDLGADLITVNMSFSTVNTIVPYVTASDPNFLVSPYSGDASVRNAMLQEALLNRMWRSRKLAGNRHVTDQTVDALIYGDGWLKVGFNINERRVSEQDYAEIAELWVQRVSPWDVWIDPTSDGLHNARWIAQRLLIPKATLQADKTYKNTHDDNVSFSAHTDTATSGKDDSVRFAQEVFDGSEYAVLYEFTDLVARTAITFSDGELPLRVVEDIGDALWVQMSNYRIPNSPYHMGELEQLWALQRELNKTRTHMINHRARNVQKFLVRDGVLEPAAIAALRSNIVNDVVFVKGTEPLENMIQPAQVPGLQADVYNISDLVQRDIYEISGVNEYLRGATPEIRRTATEATIIEGASNIKTQAKLRMVENAVKEAGFLLLGIARDVFPLTAYDEIQLFLTGRQAESVGKAVLGDEINQLMGQPSPDMAQVGALQAQLAGPPQDLAISPSPDIFVGEYEVEVEQASTEMRNPQMRFEKARSLAGEAVAMAPALMQFGVNLNLKRFLELLYEAASIDDIDALFLPGPGGVPAPTPPMGQPATGQPPGPPPGGMPPQQAGPPQELIDALNSGMMPPA